MKTSCGRLSTTLGLLGRPAELQIRKERCVVPIASIVLLGALANVAPVIAGEPASHISDGLIGFWKLAGDCKDSSVKKNHGINRGVVFEKTGRGLAARFDGNESYIEVPNNAVLNPGTNDFSISVWVKCDPGVTGPPGDIINKFDPVSRNGVNLHISASAPGYSSVSDVRNVGFGIDNAVEGDWVDCGRPWFENTLISTIIVYRGRLYTGLADAIDPGNACRVFSYSGGTNWTDCGRLGTDPKTPSVQSIIVHKGELYAGTGVADWEKVWTRNAGPTHVYRYEGGTQWHDCGKFGSGYRVLSLASANGELYASDDKGFQYRYEADNHWVLCGDVNQQAARKDKKIYSMMVYRSKLYGGSSTTVHRFEGATLWDTVAQFDPKAINQIHTLEVWRGRLFAGTWPEGKVMRYDTDQNWEDCGNMGIETVNQKINEINELTAYNGMLYAGALPKGEVWRYGDGRQWVRVRQLVQNPAWDAGKLVSWNRVPCMTVYQGKLFVGTSTCHGRAEAEPSTDAGKVFSWEAGKSVSFDDDIGTGWRHLVAVRQANRLQLYIDGRLVASSSDFEGARFNLSNPKPLLIGFGERNYFRGQLSELRVYSRALKDNDIAYLYSNPISSSRSK
jgi:hypothetical protein